MSFDPEHLFALAQELDAQARQPGLGQVPGLREAKLRDAISRAYYAAFWCGRRYFAKAQPPQRLSRFNPHAELQDLFNRYPARSMKVIAYNLQHLHRMRSHADYDPLVPRLETEAAHALRLANRLLNAIGNLPADPMQAP
jgi:uncharacterized protein (UPF0332 family)